MEKKYRITLTICFALLLLLVPSAIVIIVNNTISGFTNKEASPKETFSAPLELNKLVADETVLVSKENKYARLNFRVLDSKVTIVTIKAVTYDVQSEYKTTMIQEPFNIEGDKLVVSNIDNERILEIYLKNDYIEVKSLTQDYEIYSGKYYTKEDSLEYVNLLPEGKYSGIYVDENEPLRKVTVLNTGKNEKTNEDLVSFSAFMYSGSEVFIRLLNDESKPVNDNTTLFSMDNDFITLKFSDEKIEMHMVNIKDGVATEVESLINGEYKKQEGYLVKDLDALLANQDCYDNYCENK